MKRIVLASIAVLGLLLAQTSFAQVQLGIRGGGNWGFASKPAFLGSLTPTLHPSLLLKVNLSDGAVQPYLIAGPSVGYALDGRIRTRATALFSTQPYDVDLNYGGMLNRWDFSAVGGLGLAMDAGAGKFFIEGRYTHGFTRQVQVPIVNVDVRNRGIAASIGYSFPIGY